MLAEIRYAPLFRIFSIVGILTFWGMAFVSWMSYRVEGEWLGFVLLWPLLAIGLWWLLGMAASPQRVCFDQNGLTVQRWLGTRRLAYGEITAVLQSYFFITIQAQNHSLRLYKLYANDDGKLINALETYVPVAKQARAQRIAAHFPVTLKGKLLAPIMSAIVGLLFLAFTVGASWFGVLHPVESGLAYQIMMFFFVLFGAILTLLFFYLLLWTFPRKTVFTADLMTQHYLLHTKQQPMRGIIAFESGHDVRTVRGVERQLYKIIFCYENGQQFDWIPHEFDFPLDYLDAAAAGSAAEWIERLRSLYLILPVSNIATIAALNEAYKQWGARIGWELAALATEAQHDGTSHVELVAGHFHLVVTERGSELTRQLFTDSAAILQRLFIDLAFGAGVVFEQKHRVAGKDGRRLIFSHQLEILGKLNAAWYKTAEKEIAETLRQYPYNDKI